MFNLKKLSSFLVLGTMCTTSLFPYDVVLAQQSQNTGPKPLVTSEFTVDWTTVKDSFGAEFRPFKYQPFFPQEDPVLVTRTQNQRANAEKTIAPATNLSEKDQGIYNVMSINSLWYAGIFGDRWFLSAWYSPQEYTFIPKQVDGKFWYSELLIDSFIYNDKLWEHLKPIVTVTYYDENNTPIFTSFKNGGATVNPIDFMSFGDEHLRLGKSQVVNGNVVPQACWGASPLGEWCRVDDNSVAIINSPNTNGGPNHDGNAAGQENFRKSAVPDDQVPLTFGKYKMYVPIYADRFNDRPNSQMNVDKDATDSGEQAFSLSPLKYVKVKISLVSMLNGINPNNPMPYLMCGRLKEDTLSGYVENEVYTEEDWTRALRPIETRWNNTPFSYGFTSEGEYGNTKLLQKNLGSESYTLNDLKTSGVLSIKDWIVFKNGSRFQINTPTTYIGAYMKKLDQTTSQMLVESGMRKVTPGTLDNTGKINIPYGQRPALSWNFLESRRFFQDQLSLRVSETNRYLKELQRIPSSISYLQGDSKQVWQYNTLKFSFNEVLNFKDRSTDLYARTAPTMKPVYKTGPGGIYFDLVPNTTNTTYKDILVDFERQYGVRQNFNVSIANRSSLYDELADYFNEEFTRTYQKEYFKDIFVEVTGEPTLVDTPEKLNNEWISFWEVFKLTTGEGTRSHVSTTWTPGLVDEMIQKFSIKVPGHDLTKLGEYFQLYNPLRLGVVRNPYYYDYRTNPIEIEGNTKVTLNWDPVYLKTQFALEDCSKLYIFPQYFSGEQDWPGSKGSELKKKYYREAIESPYLEAIDGKTYVPYSIGQGFGFTPTSVVPSLYKLSDTWGGAMTQLNMYDSAYTYDGRYNQQDTKHKANNTLKKFLKNELGEIMPQSFYHTYGKAIGNYTYRIGMRHTKSMTPVNQEHLQSIKTNGVPNLLGWAPSYDWKSLSPQINAYSISSPSAGKLVTSNEEFMTTFNKEIKDVENYCNKLFPGDEMNCFSSLSPLSSKYWDKNNKYYFSFFDLALRYDAYFNESPEMQQFIKTAQSNANGKEYSETLGVNPNLFTNTSHIFGSLARNSWGGVSGGQVVSPGTNDTVQNEGKFVGYVPSVIEKELVTFEKNSNREVVDGTFSWQTFYPTNELLHRVYTGNPATNNGARKVDALKFNLTLPIWERYLKLGTYDLDAGEKGNPRTNMAITIQPVLETTSVPYDNGLNAGVTDGKLLYTEKPAEQGKDQTKRLQYGPTIVEMSQKQGDVSTTVNEQINITSNQMNWSKSFAEDNGEYWVVGEAWTFWTTDFEWKQVPAYLFKGPEGSNQTSFYKVDLYELKNALIAKYKDDPAQSDLIKYLDNWTFDEHTRRLTSNVKFRIWFSNPNLGPGDQFLPNSNVIYLLTNGLTGVLKQRDNNTYLNLTMELMKTRKYVESHGAGLFYYKDPEDQANPQRHSLASQGTDEQTSDIVQFRIYTDTNDNTATLTNPYLATPVIENLHFVDFTPEEREDIYKNLNFVAPEGTSDFWEQDQTLKPVSDLETLNGTQATQDWWVEAGKKQGTFQHPNGKTYAKVCIGAEDGNPTFKRTADAENALKLPTINQETRATTLKGVEVSNQIVCFYRADGKTSEDLRNNKDLRLMPAGYKDPKTNTGDYKEDILPFADVYIKLRSNTERTELGHFYSPYNVVKAAPNKETKLIEKFEPYKTKAELDINKETIQDKLKVLTNKGTLDKFSKVNYKEADRSVPADKRTNVQFILVSDKIGTENYDTIPEDKKINNNQANLVYKLDWVPPKTPTITYQICPFVQGCGTGVPGQPTPPDNGTGVGVPGNPTPPNNGTGVGVPGMPPLDDGTGGHSVIPPLPPEGNGTGGWIAYPPPTVPLNAGHVVMPPILIQNTSGRDICDLHVWTHEAGNVTDMSEGRYIPIDSSEDNPIKVVDSTIDPTKKLEAGQVAGPGGDIRLSLDGKELRYRYAVNGEGNSVTYTMKYRYCGDGAWKWHVSPPLMYLTNDDGVCQPKGPADYGIICTLESSVNDINGIDKGHSNPAGTVLKGDKVFYKVTCTNTSDKDIYDLQIKLPTPGKTTYVSGPKEEWTGIGALPKGKTVSWKTNPLDLTKTVTVKDTIVKGQTIKADFAYRFKASEYSEDYLEGDDCTKLKANVNAKDLVTITSLRGTCDERNEHPYVGTPAQQYPHAPAPGMCVTKIPTSVSEYKDDNKACLVVRHYRLDFDRQAYENNAPYNNRTPMLEYGRGIKIDGVTNNLRPEEAYGGPWGNTRYTNDTCRASNVLTGTDGPEGSVRGKYVDVSVTTKIKIPNIVKAQASNITAYTDFRGGAVSGVNMQKTRTTTSWEEFTITATFSDTTGDSEAAVMQSPFQSVLYDGRIAGQGKVFVEYRIPLLAESKWSETSNVLGGNNTDLAGNTITDGNTVVVESSNINYSRKRFMSHDSNVYCQRNTHYARYCSFGGCWQYEWYTWTKYSDESTRDKVLETTPGQRFTASAETNLPICVSSPGKWVHVVNGPIMVNDMLKSDGANPLEDIEHQTDVTNPASFNTNWFVGQASNALLPSAFTQKNAQRNGNSEADNTFNLDQKYNLFSCFEYDSQKNEWNLNSETDVEPKTKKCQDGKRPWFYAIVEGDYGRTYNFTKSIIDGLLSTGMNLSRVEPTQPDIKDTVWIFDRMSNNGQQDLIIGQNGVKSVKISGQGSMFITEDREDLKKKADPYNKSEPEKFKAVLNVQSNIEYSTTVVKTGEKIGDISGDALAVIVNGNMRIGSQVEKVDWVYFVNGDLVIDDSHLPLEMEQVFVTGNIYVNRKTTKNSSIDPYTGMQEKPVFRITGGGKRYMFLQPKVFTEPQGYENEQKVDANNTLLDCKFHGNCTTN